MPINIFEPKFVVVEVDVLDFTKLYLKEIQEIDPRAANWNFQWVCAEPVRNAYFI